MVSHLPSSLQSNEKSSDGIESTTEHSTPRSKHVMPRCCCLTGWRLGHECLKLVPSQPNIGDGLQCPMKLIPKVLESQGWSFKHSSVNQL